MTCSNCLTETVFVFEPVPGGPHRLCYECCCWAYPGDADMFATAFWMADGVTENVRPPAVN